MKKIIFTILLMSTIRTFAQIPSDTSYRTNSITTDKKTVIITETTIWHQDIDKFYENLKADSIAEQSQKKQSQNQNAEHDKNLSRIHSEMGNIRIKKK